MNNDMVYLVMMILGTLTLGMSTALKHPYQKVLFFTITCFLFLQAGICVYNGVYGNSLAMRHFSFFKVY